MQDPAFQARLAEGQQVLDRTRAAHAARLQEQQSIPSTAARMASNSGTPAEAFRRHYANRSLPAKVLGGLKDVAAETYWKATTPEVLHDTGASVSWGPRSAPLSMENIEFRQPYRPDGPGSSPPPGWDQSAYERGLAAAYERLLGGGGVNPPAESLDAAKQEYDQQYLDAPPTGGASPRPTVM